MGAEVTQMDLFTAIYERQSMPKVRPDPVPREVVERLLGAAVQAPNHYRVRPWRFIVLTGAARERLGARLAQSLKERAPETPVEALQAEAARPLRAPLLIAVGVDQPAAPKVLEVENICAAAAAVQNLLLAAHALGLGAIWRTGPAALDPQVKTCLGLEPAQHLIGFLYIGYPEAERPPLERPSFDDRTTWLE
jgi:nitroreductase